MKTKSILAKTTIALMVLGTLGVAVLVISGRLDTSLFWIKQAAPSLYAGMSGVTDRTPLQATSGGKQIVFMLDDPGSKLISVTITGYNQNNEWKSWRKESQNGFMLAYTKDWWWTENFVQISFVVEDHQTRTTSSKSCLIDALVQPRDSPRIEIVYNRDKGCAGGDAGSVQDPVKKKIIQPVKDAFATMNYYQDFDVDVFLKILLIETDVVVCTVGVGSALKSGGLSYAAAKSIIDASCRRTATEVLKLFVKP